MKEKLSDNHTIEQYFFEYFGDLHRYAYTLLKDNEEARDAVQQVFMLLWEKKETLSIKQSVRAYLYAATHNHCLNRIKSLQTRQRHYKSFATGQEHATWNNEEQVSVRALKKEVLSAMESLPDKCREVFYKSRFEEKTYAEIAKELDISVKTVEAHMGKALHALRTKLSDKTYFWILISFRLLTEIQKFFH
ncbi:RNA polymerase sigma-70 factor [Chitinophaga sancti]|uniref:RNA polymerase sigma-70 factor n=1 Tax=Chitinophaga sancti TaxID=1004 RepID=UPI002A753730|nr:RNA polymerase sigma-70 factor [Chitinophaga sancti]WPQ65613.1 RNA polymerase sigma-70 factor [Chitinophaga sancti]